MLSLRIILLLLYLLAAAQSYAADQEVYFYFDNHKLSNIVELIASKKNINIIPPQLPADSDIFKKQTITYKPKNNKLINLEKAFNLLQEFLELAGFSLFKKEENTYAIVKSGTENLNTGGIGHEPLPIYKNIDWQNLPNNNSYIRYIAYLKNLKVPGNIQEDNPLNQIFRSLLSQGANVAFDPKSNSIIIAEKDAVIKSIMNIIMQLDNSGFSETILVVPIYNISAQEVVKAFNLLKSATGEQNANAQDNILSYFSKDTKIIPDPVSNTIILMGKENILQRLSEFIAQHIDVSPQSANSILHTYDLQYLDAQSFAPVLQRIVSNRNETTQNDSAQSDTGPYRFFQGVAIVAEPSGELKIEVGMPTQEIKLNGGSNSLDNLEVGINGLIRTGGNRLIIAALHDDWVYIQDLIKKLDTAQPQVILEVLVVDFTYESATRLAGTSRNPTDNAFFDGLQYLSSNITPPINVLGSNPTRLAQDLLQVSNNSLTDAITPGSMILSFNDPNTPGIFGLLQLLQRYLGSKIISHPFLIVGNNKKATLTNIETRRANSNFSYSAGGTFTIPKEDVTATFNLELIPTLASLDRVRLSIRIQIEEFLGTTLNRLNRAMSTTAQLSNGQILALGGLLKTDRTDAITKTPIAGDVPFLGWLFQGDTGRTNKSNIMIFACPTTIQPRHNNKTINLYTAQKIEAAHEELENYTTLTNSFDPVTRLFFGQNNKSLSKLDTFFSHGSNSFKIKKIKLKTQEKQESNLHLFSKNLPNKTIIGQNTDTLKNLLAQEENPFAQKIKYQEAQA